jgi:cysteinyl-tRNA synthetase
LANFWIHGHFLLFEQAKMAKSAGDFLRTQTLIDQGYDPLAYRYFCMGAHYRAKLSFTWEALGAAATALQRLRTTAYDWGQPGEADLTYLNRFKEQINEDLNMPRTLAVVWELVKDDLSPATKKATLLQFDRVLGLRLADWQPKEAVIPPEIMALVEEREKARSAKQWKKADALREQVRQAGYEIEDTPKGPKIKRRSRDSDERPPTK